MGLDITVVMADWAQLARIPADERLEALTDTVCPPFCCERCEEADYAVKDGWVWWPRESPWCAEYRFFGTTGSYSWHFRLTNAWEDVRPFAAPELREALDCFLIGLMWDGPWDPTATEPDDDYAAAGGFPDDPTPWRPHALVLRAPDEVPPLLRAWEVAAPRLEELRGAFDAEASRWAGRPANFDAAVALLHEWGEVVTQAAARGWGVIGLPY
jgi:hypothetical protein